MARTNAQKTRLGFFVVLGTALIIIASYLIGNNQSLFSKTFTVTTVFNNVNGLQLGNNVRYSGIVVGTVKGIEMENDSTIRVRMSIEEKMHRHIKKDAIATIGSDGLVGSMIVNIIPGKGASEVVGSGEEIDSYSRIGAEDMLSTLNVTNQNAALLTADLLKVTQSLKNGEGTLGKLLNDTLMAQNLQEIVVNLKYTSVEANSAMKELNSIIEAIDLEESVAGVLLNDSLMAQKMRKTIQNMETSSVAMDSLLQNLNGTVNQMKEGKGTVNLLVKDTLLANQLQRTMDNIEQGTERFNENMEALKHNFLTRRYFKRQEKESRKKE
ncbi:MlaD family protein [Flagellimonas sp.]|uniref:MlaD family protein n=1 Tax=Flagellimonas sp. TaxID=2058762 RepID=UPI003B5953BD